jgi:hypothetical protein
LKIKVLHTECGREALVQQVRDSSGHCPWDGKPYSKDYTANLAEALETAEAAGSALERALDKIVGTSPELRLEEESVLAAVRGKIEEINAAARAVAT